MRLALTMVLALAGLAASAQPLQIRAASLDAPDDAGGMARYAVGADADREVWVGDVLLSVPRSDVQTVGLELDADGSTAVSVWLVPGAAESFARVTASSVGQTLAVMYGGRVLTAPTVVSEIRNGLVMIAGLDGAAAERLATALREGAVPPEPVGDEGAVELSTPRMPTADRTAVADESDAVGVARRFADAAAARDWRTVADALHPDAVSAARARALVALSVDGDAVRLVDRGRRVVVADVLGDGAVGDLGLEDLPDHDLVTLYLSALSQVSAWGLAMPVGAATAEFPDGDRLYVWFRSAETSPGVSTATIVTLARDGASWKPLLPASL